MGDIQVQNDLYANYDKWNKNVAATVGDNFEGADISNLNAFEIAKGYGQDPEGYKSSFLQIANENISLPEELDILTNIKSPPQYYSCSNSLG